MSLVTLSFIQYNNYFNKILRKPASPFLRSSYSSFPVKSVINNAAFNENDGVTAYHVVPNDIDDVGDYLLVHISNNILSHWFVTEAKRNRLGQCMVTLQRDLLVDYYDTIKSAPAFIERGMLNNNDPMIFNDEGLSFNQIKDSEILLSDKTGCGWIIGYLSKDAFSTDTPISADVTFTNDTSESITSYDSWADVPEVLNNLINGTTRYIGIQESSMMLYMEDIGYIEKGGSQAYYVSRLGGTINDDFELDGCSLNSRNLITGNKHSLRNYNLKNTTRSSDGQILGEAAIVIRGEVFGNNKTSIINTLGINDSSIYDSILFYGDTKIKVGGTTYLIKKKVSEEIIAERINDYSSLYNQLILTADEYVSLGLDEFKFVGANGSSLSTLNGCNLVFGGSATVITLEATPAGEKATVTIKANRQKTIDAQYDMFAIPYGDKGFYLGSFRIPYYRKLNKEASLAIAQEIAIKSSTQLYDLQILPYCPVQEIIRKHRTSAGIVEFTSIDESNSCSIITNENNVAQSFILWCSKTSFSLILDDEIPLSADGKAQKNLEKYRLSGGNYASMFDFTPDMNGGIYGFNVYCDYKPYKPFVKVNPKFSYLYGEDFKDPLGLILSGDFSLTIMQNQWQTYLLNNKNYEAMFDRQIQSVELGNDVAYQSSLWSAVAGTMGGTATGAVAGGMKGGAYGAIAGAIVGGISSGVGGAIDVANQDNLRTDSLNLQKDLHAFQLDNIKALPNTIQKLTSLVQINKIFPILEHYTCTPKEREYFANYIKYNGMSVGRIDTIKNFESNGGFIQGRFIRLEGLSEDYHLANAINTTFQAGFYFEED